MNPNGGRNPYADNPFDQIYGAPQQSSMAGPRSPVKPIAQQAGSSSSGQNLDDLLNPFAVLGLENKGGAVRSPPSAGGSPRGMSGQYTASAYQQQQQQQQPAVPGFSSPRPLSASNNPYAVPAQPQQPQQQQQQAQWGSPHSAFQPPSQVNTNQGYSPSYGAANVSPSVSPANSYGAPSPAYGSYSPASPAFMSAPQQQQAAYAAPYSSGSFGSNNSSTGAPLVSDADLSLFTAPVVAVVKPAPKPATAASEQQSAGGWAPTVSPQANDGWDNDDFGISWEQPKKAPEPSSKLPGEAAVESPKQKTAATAEALSPKSKSIEASIAGEHKMEGNVLARISVRTLIVKEWKETFWIITGGKLLLYRSKEDYLYNPVGVMVKKDIPLRDNLRCSEVTCKPYKGYGDLYHFTLEEMLDYGPSLIAKFASTDVKAIRELRAVIIAYIIAERKKRVGRRTPQPGPSSEMRTASPAGHEAAAAAPRSGGSPKPADSAEQHDKYAKWGNIN